MDPIILVFSLLYFAVLIGIGVFFGRKKQNYSEYHLAVGGGKPVPGWALAVSERSTEASAWLLLGATGFAFTTGLSSVYIFIGMVLGVVVSWLFLARIFMNERKKYGVLTLPDYLAARFPKFNTWIRILGVLIIVPFFTLYIGTQIGGAGDTAEQAMGANSLAAMIIVAVVIIFYTLFGGFLAVVWADAFQGILMVVTLTVLPTIAMIQIFTSDISITDSLQSAGEGMGSWTGGLTGFGLGLLLYTNLSWALGYLGGQPHVSARFMSLDSEKEYRTGRRTAIIWALLAYSGSFAVGITGIVLYGTNGPSDSEMILPFMLNELLPSWVVGILLSGILAAIMSTASSQLMVVTSTLTEDLVKDLFKVNLSNKQLVTLSRVIVGVVGAVGLFVGLASTATIYEVVGWAWAGVGNSFAAAILLTFFWKKTSGVGVVAAMAGGFISTVIWINSPLEEVFTVRGASLVIALLAGIVFSLLFPGKTDDKVEKSPVQEEPVTGD